MRNPAGTTIGPEVDDFGYLMRFEDWTESFADDLAPDLGISTGLTSDHWRVINFIRDFYRTIGHCPLVYQTCRANNIRLRRLGELFPAGYLRGACRLAGLSRSTSYPPFAQLMQYRELPDKVEPGQPPMQLSYRIDPCGFLLDPAGWDRGFARLKAFEMKTPVLDESHWRVIDYLREKFLHDEIIPTVIQTCSDLQIELEDLERLFPDGYNRGAVKMAGLNPGPGVIPLP